MISIILLTIFIFVLAAKLLEKKQDEKGKVGILQAVRFWFLAYLVLFIMFGVIFTVLTSFAHDWRFSFELGFFVSAIFSLEVLAYAIISHKFEVSQE